MAEYIPFRFFLDPPFVAASGIGIGPISSSSSFVRGAFSGMSSSGWSFLLRVRLPRTEASCSDSSDMVIEDRKDLLPPRGIVLDIICNIITFHWTISHAEVMHRLVGESDQNRPHRYKSKEKFKATSQDSCPSP